jgi:CO/xanthine dehydrogenase Mo-binding subunit
MELEPRVTLLAKNGCDQAMRRLYCHPEWPARCFLSDTISVENGTLTVQGRGRKQSVQETRSKSREWVGKPSAVSSSAAWCTGSVSRGGTGITGAAEAIANAVYHATVRHLPIAPDKLL